MNDNMARILISSSQLFAGVVFVIVVFISDWIPMWFRITMGITGAVIAILSVMVITAIVVTDTRR